MPAQYFMIGGNMMASGVESLPKAALGKRFLASLIDGVAVFIVGLIPFVGYLIGIAYMLTRDAAVFMITKNEDFKNRSLGKKIMGIRVINLSGEEEVDLITSLKRNFTLVIGAIVASIISLMVGTTASMTSLFEVGAIDPAAMGMGLLAAALVLVVVWALSVIPAAVECLLVLTDGKGRRLGDRFAGTQIVED